MAIVTVYTPEFHTFLACK